MDAGGSAAPPGWFIPDQETPWKCRWHCGHCSAQSAEEPQVPQALGQLLVLLVLVAVCCHEMDMGRILESTGLPTGREQLGIETPTWTPIPSLASNTNFFA